MIQYRIHTPEQAREAISRGVRWITLASPTPESILATIPLCRDADVILVTEGQHDLALSTLADGDRVNGVILSDADGLEPLKARELLGPHAIIGYAATSPERILSLTGADLDYFTLPADAMTPELSAVEEPIVAVGLPGLPSELPHGFHGILIDFKNI